jgi:hypothetical protein
MIGGVGEIVLVEICKNSVACESGFHLSRCDVVRTNLTRESDRVDERQLPGFDDRQKRRRHVIEHVPVAERSAVGRGQGE